MKFPQNKGKTAEFSDTFNQIAFKPLFDEEKFYAEAEKAGYTEARVQRPGGSIMLERDRTDRITAQITEQGKVKRYRIG